MPSRRSPHPAAILALTAISCGPPPAPPPPRPFVHTSAGGTTVASAGASTAGTAPRGPTMRRGITTPPPAVSAAPECPMGVESEIGRYRVGGRAFHAGPICTPSYQGEWAAVFVTGTPREATDVWIAVRSARGVELHRLRRAPVGVRYTGGTIVNGFAYLTGQSLATQEMPANAEVLVTFAIPFPGDPDPVALGLSPLDVPLLGARDRAELEQRLAGPPVQPESSATAAQSTVGRILQVGPRGLISALPSGRAVPVLRAWQLGVYERLANLHPEIDPANARVTTAFEVVHSLEGRMNCSAGERCLALPAPDVHEPSEVAVPPQLLLRRDGPNTVIAAIIDTGHRPDEFANPTEERLSAPVYDNPEDRRLAEALALDGSIHGRVTAVTRGTTRILAYDVAAGSNHRTDVFVVFPERAPRRFEDRVFGPLATGAREVQFRDVESNYEPELVTLAHLSTGEDAIGVSTLLWPPAVVDRTTYARLDLQRAALGAHSFPEADRAFRAWSPYASEREAMCPVLERVLAQPPRTLAAAAPQGLVQIEYATAGQPLRGTLRRMDARAIRAAASGNDVLGPFAGARCDALQCDWFQGYCRQTGEWGEAGYLWLTGRRNAPLWGVSVLTGH
jgi:hypothetical protein